MVSSNLVELLPVGACLELAMPVLGTFAVHAWARQRKEACGAAEHVHGGERHLSSLEESGTSWSQIGESGL